jgi:hypothetical protein
VLKFPLNGSKECPSGQWKPSKIRNPIVGDILRLERQFETFPEGQNRHAQVVEETAVNQEHVGTI